MRYFIISQDPNCVDAPNIIDWYGNYDVRNIRIGKSQRLPQRSLLWLQSNPSMIFTDVVSYPFFMLSPLAMKTVLLYHPNMIKKELVLLDGNNHLAQMYFVPILEEVDCLSSKSKLNLDKSILFNATFKQEMVKNKSIFKVSGVKNSYVAVSLELAESLLRRGCKGIELTMVELE